MLILTLAGCVTALLKNAYFGYWHFRDLRRALREGLQLGVEQTKPRGLAEVAF